MAKFIMIGKKHYTKPFVLLAFLLVLIMLTPAISKAMSYFNDNMEDGTTNWIADPPWGLSAESYHSGTKAWSDSPGAYYANNLDISLTMDPSVDLSTAISPKLVFWHK